MPTLPLAILVLLARFSISQMDVPTRQSYIMAVVRPDERSAAAGITGVARTTGAAIAPVFAGFMFARPALMSVPFFIAGTLKKGTLMSAGRARSEEHTSELQSLAYLVCRLL